MQNRARTLLTSAILLGVCAAPAAAANAASTAPLTTAHTASASDTSTGPANGVPIPATGAYAGAAVNAQGDQSWPEAFANFEQQSGRNLALQRMYQQWGATTITPLTRWDALNGVIPALSISSPKWSEVASGADDAEIVAQAQAFKAFGSPVMLTFNHEPELDQASLGTPADYVAAWRHWVNIYRQQGVTNVSFTWILMASSFGRTGATATAFYPGDAYVDWIGVDGYNWYNVCKTLSWMSFSDVFAGFRSWTVGHGKPLFIAEVGSAEDSADPGRKAQWIADMGTTLKSWPEVKAVSWFNWYPPAGNQDCQQRVTTSAAAISGWDSTVADPYLGQTLATVQQGTPQQVAPPAVDPAAMVVVPGQKPQVPFGVTSTNATAIVHVDYGTTSSYGTSTPDQVVPASTSSVPMTVTLPKLLPLTTYHYRVVAENSAGTTASPDMTVQMPASPTPVTQPVSQVLGSTATFAGTVTPNGLPTTVQFIYGPSTAYGKSTAPVSVPAGWAPQTLTQQVSGLNPGWTYHVRLLSTNALGTSKSADMVFHTAALPKVDTWLPGTRTSTSMTLRGTVAPGVLDTTWYFQYGTTTAYGSATTSVLLKGGSAAASVQSIVNGLPSNTQYHYRIVAVNGAGTSYGPDRTGGTAR